MGDVRRLDVRHHQQIRLPLELACRAAIGDRSVFRQRRIGMHLAIDPRARERSVEHSPRRGACARRSASHGCRSSSGTGARTFGSIPNPRISAQASIVIPTISSALGSGVMWGIADEERAARQNVSRHRGQIPHSFTGSDEVAYVVEVIVERPRRCRTASRRRRPGVSRAPPPRSPVSGTTLFARVPVRPPCGP